MFVNPKQQRRVVSVPRPTDKDLREYSGNIQGNLSDLFAASHDHVVSANDQANYAALTTDAQRIQFLASWLGLQ